MIQEYFDWTSDEPEDIMDQLVGLAQVYLERHHLDPNCVQVSPADKHVIAALVPLAEAGVEVVPDFGVRAGRAILSHLKDGEQLYVGTPDNGDDDPKDGRDYEWAEGQYQRGRPGLSTQRRSGQFIGVMYSVPGLVSVANVSVPEVLAAIDDAYDSFVRRMGSQPNSIALPATMPAEARDEVVAALYEQREAGQRPWFMGLSRFPVTPGHLRVAYEGGG